MVLAEYLDIIWVLVKGRKTYLDLHNIGLQR